MSDPRNASHRASVKLICLAGNELLLIRPKNKGDFNLVWWWVDRWEDIVQTIKREFLEETGNELWNIEPRLIHTEIKNFPAWGPFDAVVNIFYLLSFDKKFDISLEEWVYEEFKRCSKKELEKVNVTEHSNKELLLRVIES